MDGSVLWEVPYTATLHQSRAGAALAAAALRIGEICQLPSISRGGEGGTPRMKDLRPEAVHALMLAAAAMRHSQAACAQIQHRLR